LDLKRDKARVTRAAPGNLAIPVSFSVPSPRLDLRQLRLPSIPYPPTPQRVCMCANDYSTVSEWLTGQIKVSATCLFVLAFEILVEILVIGYHDMETFF